MIRVEITEFELVGEQYGLLPEPKPNHPDAPPAEPKWHRRRTLLLQDFEQLNVERVICEMNKLEQRPLCECGHQWHRGRCAVSDGSGYGSGCDCRKYRSDVQASRDAADTLRQKLDQDVSEARGQCVALVQTLAQREQALDILRADLVRSRATLARVRERHRH